jgi:hypothetical protein
MEDEINMLTTINVSGTYNWDCFITISHFQQCGMCSPSAKTYIQTIDINTHYLNYVWDPRGLTIRPCAQACQYIYNRCLGATLLNGDPVIPPGVDLVTFCSQYPTESTPELPCYNGGSGTRYAVAAGLLMVALVLSLF